MNERSFDRAVSLFMTGSECKPEAKDEIQKAVDRADRFHTIGPVSLFRGRFR